MRDLVADDPDALCGVCGVWIDGMLVDACVAVGLQGSACARARLGWGWGNFETLKLY